MLQNMIYTCQNIIYMHDHNYKYTPTNLQLYTSTINIFLQFKNNIGIIKFQNFQVALIIIIFRLKIQTFPL